MAKLYRHTEQGDMHFVGVGDTPARSKADYIRQCVAACQGTYNPRILTAHGVSLLVYRTPNSWGISIIMAPWMEGVKEHPMYGSTSGYGTVEAAESGARRHLAQLVHDMGHDGGEVLATEGERVEYARWCECQERYRRALEEGMEESAAQRGACEGGV